uniref:Putative secreted protein n=1 Tax=Anopheles darlingi TaxID=43151 RepID=A0A2M4DQ48_ANODA
MLRKPPNCLSVGLGLGHVLLTIFVPEGMSLLLPCCSCCVPPPPFFSSPSPAIPFYSSHESCNLITNADTIAP